MNNHDREETLKQAIETFGEEPQHRQLQEELAELIAATSRKLRRDRTDDNFIEEFVDADIVLDQIRPTLNQETYKRIEKEKLERLKKAIEEFKQVEFNSVKN